MFKKFGKSTLVQVERDPEKIILLGTPVGSVQRRLAGKRGVKLDPDRYLYTRNRAISAEELWGPNQNFDGFPGVELLRGHLTFTGQMIDIDHDPSLDIGSIIDSAYIPTAVMKQEMKDAAKKAADAVGTLSPFSGIDKLEEGDQIVGNWIENVWAIDKEALNGLYPNAVEAILDGEITDTSMGTMIQFSECNICGHQTTDPMVVPYCEHISVFGVNKGLEYEHPVTGTKVRSYERCYGLSFFEDSLIMPETWNGYPGSQGADVSAKILQVVASKIGKTESRRLASTLRAIYSSIESPKDKEEFIRILQSI